MDDRDKTMFQLLREFQPYDLYSKGDDRTDVEELKPDYGGLIDEYVPSTIAF